MGFATSVLAGSGSTRHGLPPKPKILATPLRRTDPIAIECAECGLTVDDDDVQHSGVAVGGPTDVDASVRHLTGSNHQHTDEHLSLHLLCYDDAARSIRAYLLAVLYTQTCDFQYYINWRFGVKLKTSTWCLMYSPLCCLVAQWLGRWIRDREVASSTPGVCVSK